MKCVLTTMTEVGEKEEMKKLAHFLKDRMNGRQLWEYSNRVTEALGDNLDGHWELKLRIAKQVKRDVK